jgi:hypothetical protein
MADRLYNFKRPTKENVSKGDLIVSRDVDGMGIDGLVIVDDMDEKGIRGKGMYTLCRVGYYFAVVYTMKGELLVGEGAENQIMRDLAFTLSGSSITEMLPVPMGGGKNVTG